MNLMIVLGLEKNTLQEIEGLGQDTGYCLG